MTKLHELACRIENERAQEFEAISRFIFEHPEPGLMERESAAYLIDYMRDKGFAVETPLCGFETAFLACFGSEGPVIDFLAEYDALPGYGGDQGHGHACGHNWIAATTAGAAVVLGELVGRGEIRARIRLVGCPAEESFCTKAKLAEDGVFSGTALALQCHLSNESSVHSRALAMDSLIFSYRGKAAHAAGAPWDGVNALDAVQLLFAGVNALRQHLRPDVRIHGVVREGGQAANIVPDRASAVFYVRAATRAYLVEVIDKVLNVAKGAALMTGAALELERPEMPLDDLAALPLITALCEKHLRRQGVIPTVTPERAKETAGSTDVGNVSHACPTAYMEVALDAPTPFLAHEESALALADGAYAHKALHQAVNAMTGVALELIEDPALIDKIREEFMEHCR